MKKVSLLLGLFLTLGLVSFTSNAIEDVIVAKDCDASAADAYNATIKNGGSEATANRRYFVVYWDCIDNGGTTTTQSNPGIVDN